MEVVNMFEGIAKSWFDIIAATEYSYFIKALLTDEIDSMNEFINDIALNTIPYFETTQSASSKSMPERFYHGFVFVLMV